MRNRIFGDNLFLGNVLEGIGKIMFGEKKNTMREK